LGQTFLAKQFFFLYRYFLETTTDSDMVLQVLLQFYNNHGFVAISVVTMLFCPKHDN